MRYNDRTVGYMIARESSRDTSTKLLYCTEAIVALMMQARLMSTAPPLPQDEITTVVIDELHNRSAHSDYVLALTLAVMQKTSDLRLVLMSATRDHQLACDQIPHCQQLVMKGAMHHVKRYFLAQPMDRSFNMLNMIAQIVITYHNDRAGKPLVDDTCHSRGVNPSNKIMVFLFGLAQIHQFCEILQRALDFGWTEMLTPLPFHGQSSTECVDAMFAEPSVLAAIGKYPLGQNSSIYDPAAFKESEAPQGVQEIWAACREPRSARSCSVCTNVPESGVTVPNVGLVISSGVQRRVSTDIGTGSTVNALQTLSKAQLFQQLGRTGRIDQGVHITMMSHRQYASQGPQTWHN